VTSGLSGFKVFSLHLICFIGMAIFRIGISSYVFYVIVIHFQVFDATNSTWDRRQMIKEIVVNKMGFKLFFVESVCDDPQIIEQNIMVSCPGFFFLS
jgi:hypothetical protein